METQTCTSEFFVNVGPVQQLRVSAADAEELIKAMQDPLAIYRKVKGIGYPAGDDIHINVRQIAAILPASSS